jgi:hypothetical protein
LASVKNLRCGFLAADEIMIKSALPYLTDPDGHHERRLRGRKRGSRRQG